MQCFVYEKDTEILKRIQVLLQQKKRVILAIDGRCGAGKSTFAQFLQQKTGAEVIHADDFFLRPEQRTSERMQQPGGNIDYERMKQEVIDHLLVPQVFTYTPYECAVQALGTPKLVSAAPVLIVEGAYSMHPYFGSYYDIAVVMTADTEERLHRIGARGHHNNLEQFRTRWMPMEEAYLKAFDIESRADFILYT